MNTAEQRKQLEESIVYAKDALSKGLLLPEDASQLRSMIAYYEEKLEELDDEATYSIQGLLNIDKEEPI